MPPPESFSASPFITPMMVNTAGLPSWITSMRWPSAEMASPSNMASTSSGLTTATGRWPDMSLSEMPRPNSISPPRMSKDSGSTG